MSFRACPMLVIAAIAAVVPAAAQRHPFVLYNESNGLPRDIVLCLHQDRMGFFWFGTLAGLCRYDGQVFRTFTTRDGLRDDDIACLAEDGRGRLWIGTYFGGAMLWNGGRFTPFAVRPDSADPANLVHTVFPEGRDSVWIGTEAGLYLHDGRRTTRVFPKHPALQGPVSAILRDSRGRLLIGKANGLAVVDGATIRHYDNADGLPDPRINDVVEDGAGHVWVATEGGLCRLAGDGRIVQEHVPAPLAAAKIYSAYRDHAGGVWFATLGRGAWRFEPRGGAIDAGAWETFGVRNGLAHGDAFAVAQDREGLFWIATRLGVDKLVTESIEYYTTSEGLPGVHVTCFTGDARGGMWIGTSDGVARFSRGAFRAYPVSAVREKNYIVALLVDDRGGVWAGAEGGLYRLRGTRFVRDPRIPPGAGIVRSLLQTSDGTVLAGARHGLYALRDGGVRRYGPPDGLPESMAIALAETEGCLWVGYERAGVVRLTDTGSGYAVRDRFRGTGLVDDRVRCVCRTRDGSLWFGTRLAGAFRLVPRNGGVACAERRDVHSGLSSDALYSLFEDARGRMWFGTGGGADVLDGGATSRIAARDGLAGDQVLAIREDGDAFWFGTNFGLNRYVPDRRRAMPPPPVYIASCAVFGRDTVPVDRPASFSAGEHSLTFRFTAPSFRDEAHTSYRYRLEGADAKWSAWSPGSVVAFAHLPAGSYRLVVEAMTADGRVSARDAAFAFVVAAPVWARWWFVATALLAVCAAAYGAYRIRVARLLGLERLRLRIAMDLHDEMGSTLSSISLHSDVAQRLVRERPDDAAASMRRSGESARRLIASLREIVWSVDPANDTLGRVVHFARDFAVRTLADHGIACTVHAPEPDLDMHFSMEERRHLLLFLKEAVTNVVRHARCASVHIEFLREGRSLVLRVADDGVGYDGTVDAPGSGLANMRRRAAALGATLAVDSRPGAGTTVTLRLRRTA